MGARDEAAPLEAAAALLEEDDLVCAAEADGLNEPAALGELSRFARAVRAMSSQRSTLQTSSATRARRAVCQPKPPPISSTRSDGASSSAATIWATSDGCVVT